MTWSEIREKFGPKEKISLTPEMKESVFAQLEEANFGELNKGPQGGLIYQVLCPCPEEF